MTVNQTSETTYNLFNEWQAAIIVKIALGITLLLLGTFGNILSILVMQTAAMKKSTTSTYLSALAIVDICVLYLACLPEVVFTILGYQRYDFHEITCRWLNYLEFVTTDLSAWILVCLSVERFLSVVIPYSVKNVCTNKIAKITVFVTFMALCAVNSQLIILKGIGEDGLCAPLPKYNKYWKNVWLWWDMCNFSILPSIILAFCNIGILIKLKLGRKIKSTRKMSGNTSMMLLVTSAFFFNTFPSVLFQNLKPMWYTRDGHGRAVDELTWSFFLMFSYLNSAINFFLYCLGGKLFRRQLRIVLHMSDNSVSPTDLSATDANTHTQETAAG